MPLCLYTGCIYIYWRNFRTDNPSPKQGRKDFFSVCTKQLVFEVQPLRLHDLSSFDLHLSGNWKALIYSAPIENKETHNLLTFDACQTTCRRDEDFWKCATLPDQTWRFVHWLRVEDILSICYESWIGTQ